MKSRDFVFWLQGFIELAGPETLDSTQVQMIRQHLSLVFQHDADIAAKPHPAIPEPITSGTLVGPPPLTTTFIC